jgi:hypothetical protein
MVVSLMCQQRPQAPLCEIQRHLRQSDRAVPRSSSYHGCPAGEETGLTDRRYPPIKDGECAHNDLVLMDLIRLRFPVAGRREGTPDELEEFAIDVKRVQQIY